MQAFYLMLIVNYFIHFFAIWLIPFYFFIEDGPEPLRQGRESQSNSKIHC